jgi:hypothetical protein
MINAMCSRYKRDEIKSERGLFRPCEDHETEHSQRRSTVELSHHILFHRNVNKSANDVKVSTDALSNPEK